MARHDRLVLHARPQTDPTAAGLRRRVIAALPPARMLPAYLIVGVKRAGTTTLQRVITGHPAILRPNVYKGSRYFDVNYARGWSWFRSHFPTTAYGAWRRRVVGGPVMTGEASPYYLFHPLAMQRVRDALPDVKVVVVLRDPVERAWSHHAYEVARGFEHLDFETAIAVEDERLAGEEARIVTHPGYVSHAHRHYSYLARGRYDVQLRRLLAAIPREHVLAVAYEQLFADPKAHVARIHRFIGVAPVAPTTLPRLKASGASAMPPRLRRALATHFAPSNTAVYDLLDVDYGWQRP